MYVLTPPDTLVPYPPAHILVEWQAPESLMNVPVETPLCTGARDATPRARHNQYTMLNKGWVVTGSTSPSPGKASSCKCLCALIRDTASLSSDIRAPGNAKEPGKTHGNILTRAPEIWIHHIRAASNSQLSLPPLPVKNHPSVRMFILTMRLS